jgi:hypothetical protein
VPSIPGYGFALVQAEGADRRTGRSFCEHLVHGVHQIRKGGAEHLDDMLGRLAIERNR